LSFNDKVGSDDGGTGVDTVWIGAFVTLRKCADAE
jgi:hypothetical protein